MAHFDESPSANFPMQFDQIFVNINLGDAGVMYVFEELVYVLSTCNEVLCLGYFQWSGAVPTARRGFCRRRPMIDHLAEKLPCRFEGVKGGFMSIFDELEERVREELDDDNLATKNPTGERFGSLAKLTNTPQPKSSRVVCELSSKELFVHIPAAGIQLSAVLALLFGLIFGVGSLGYFYWIFSEFISILVSDEFYIPIILLVMSGVGFLLLYVGIKQIFATTDIVINKSGIFYQSGLAIKPMILNLLLDDLDDIGIDFAGEVNDDPYYTLVFHLPDRKLRFGVGLSYPEQRWLACTIRDFMLSLTEATIAQEDQKVAPLQPTF